MKIAWLKKKAAWLNPPFRAPGWKLVQNRVKWGEIKRALQNNELCIGNRSFEPFLLQSKKKKQPSLSRHLDRIKAGQRGVPGLEKGGWLAGPPSLEGGPPANKDSLTYNLPEPPKSLVWGWPSIKHHTASREEIPLFWNPTETEGNPPYASSAAW